MLLLDSKEGREPNSVRYWRLNEIEGLLSENCCLTLASSPDEYKQIVGKQLRLAGLRSREHSVADRHAGMFKLKLKVQEGEGKQ